MAKKGKFLYATIKRGKQKVKSRKQIALLEAKGLPFTKVYRSKTGKIYRKRANT